MENAWLQKKEKFLDFNASASGGFSRISARDQRFTILVSEQKRRVEIFCLFWWKTEVLPTSRLDLRLILLEDSGKTFSWKKRAVAGENYERPVVFWKPSRKEVIG